MDSEFEEITVPTDTQKLPKLRHTGHLLFLGVAVTIVIVSFVMLLADS